MRKQHAVPRSFFLLAGFSFLTGLFIAPFALPQEFYDQTTQAQSSVSANSSLISMVQKTSPGVVSITSTSGNEQIFGTGFVVSTHGVIITCAHVVKDPSMTYEVTTQGNQTYPVKIVGLHTKEDVAFLKIEGTNFPTLSLGNSDLIKPGEAIVAIGNPFGVLENTVTTGIVSGIHRDILAVDRNSKYQEGLSDVIQIDASLNPGESGGPLLNMAGEVVGINAASDSRAQNISFAIPSNVIKRLEIADGLFLNQ